jgi:hypothetical protein
MPVAPNQNMPPTQYMQQGVQDYSQQGQYRQQLPVQQQLHVPVQQQQGQYSGMQQQQSAPQLAAQQYNPTQPQQQQQQPSLMTLAQQQQQDYPATMSAQGGLPMQQGPGMSLQGPDSVGPRGRDEPIVAVPADATHSLYLDNMPSDVSKRELSHIFRPFGGFVVGCITEVQCIDVHDLNML